MPEQTLEGLALNCRPLGETDRLLTLLSEEDGLVRLAVPGAQRPRSSLAAAGPLTHLHLQVGGRSGLRRVRQLRVIHSYGRLGERLESLAAAQALAELCLRMVPAGAPTPGVLADLLMHLGRLEGLVDGRIERREMLAVAIQGTVHLLALAGFALPLQRCARSGEALLPPIGCWEWRCSLLPGEGLAIGRVPGARVMLNPSELALLQRLPRPALPRRHNGELMGPEGVWLQLLDLLELWCVEHLGLAPRAFRLLRSGFEPMVEAGSGAHP